MLREVLSRVLGLRQPRYPSHSVFTTLRRKGVPEKSFNGYEASKGSKGLSGL